MSVMAGCAGYKICSALYKYDQYKELTRLHLIGFAKILHMSN